jgi:hypothetical protein
MLSFSRSGTAESPRSLQALVRCNVTIQLPLNTSKTRQLKGAQHQQNLHVRLEFSHVRRGYAKNMNNLFIVKATRKTIKAGLPMQP